MVIQVLKEKLKQENLEKMQKFASGMMKCGIMQKKKF
jgi:hypothetical protein